MGFIESFSMFQGYKKKDPKAAGELLLNTQKRSIHTHELHMSAIIMIRFCCCCCKDEQSESYSAPLSTGLNNQ